MLLVTGGLVVLGIQNAREAQQRLACRNNVRQLGYAIHNYHDTWEMFPPATVDAPHLLPEKRLSWLVRAISFYDCTNVLIDEKQPWDSPIHRKPEMTDTRYRPPLIGLMRLFNCPSNPRQMNDEYPLTHYVGIAGLGHDAATLPKDDPRAGIFGYDRQLSLKDISDRSNTMMVAETATANGPWIAGGPATVRGLDPQRLPYLGPDGQFSSRHLGKTNVLFVDGSVRYLTDAIDPKVFESLATINGNKPAERVGED
jgi:prepilin-type processing-associated H-X9-DG protein